MNLAITQNGIVFASKADVNQNVTDHFVYEVIRVIDGVALFLENHYSRLISSVIMSGLHFDMEQEKFRSHLIQLIRINGQQNGNVKFIFNEVDGISHWSFSFIPHSYPTEDDYKKGVSTDLLFAERENPNAKVVQKAVREKANKLMESKHLYEVLLVDGRGLITEGSRSNVFFVKGNQFYTAPEANVLVGITRNKVMGCLRELKYIVHEQAVAVSEIETFDAVFLTGTSPKVLPVNRIGKIHYEAHNPFVEQLILSYNDLIDSYIKDVK